MYKIIVVSLLEVDPVCSQYRLDTKGKLIGVSEQSFLSIVKIIRSKTGNNLLKRPV